MRTTQPTARHAEALHTLAQALDACAHALKQLADAPPTPLPSPYLPIKVFCQHYPVYTESGLRSLLFFRESNGLHTAVLEVEGKLLIEVAAFFRWIELHKQTGQSTTGIIVPRRGTRNQARRAQTPAASSE